MRKIFCVLLLTGMVAVASAQDESFRVLFDKAGVAEQAARPAATPLSFENPTVAGSGRLYIYIQYGTNNQ